DAYPAPWTPTVVPKWRATHAAIAAFDGRASSRKERACFFTSRSSSWKSRHSHAFKATAIGPSVFGKFPAGKWLGAGCTIFAVPAPVNSPCTIDPLSRSHVPREEEAHGPFSVEVACQSAGASRLVAKVTPYWDTNLLKWKCRVSGPGTADFGDPMTTT